MKGRARNTEGLEITDSFVNVVDISGLSKVETGRVTYKLD